MLLRGNNHNNNDSYEERVKFNHYVLWHRSVLRRCAFTKEMRYLSNLLGGCSKRSQVTSQTQLSRPITSGHCTAWKQFWIDAYFPCVPRSLSRRSGDPQARNAIDDDQIIYWAADITLPRCHAVMTWYYNFQNAIWLAPDTTYENSQNMTTSNVMLWCQPNKKLMNIKNVATFSESRRTLFRWHQSTHHISKNLKRQWTCNFLSCCTLYKAIHLAPEHDLWKYIKWRRQKWCSGAGRITNS